MSDAPLPLVSIGMSVRNNERTLGLALRSIVGQTHENWELLLIDDGSTDCTPTIARQFAGADRRIRVYSDGLQLGLPERLNQAIAASRGTYFARMDGDDISYPRRLERQVDYLRRHPDVDLVGAGATVFHGNGTVLGKRLGPEHHGDICAHPYLHIRMMHPTFLGHIWFFRTYGYRSSAHRCEDQDLLLRGQTNDSPPKYKWMNMINAQDQDMLLRGNQCARYANVPEILLGYREEQLKLRRNLQARYYMAQSYFYVFLQRRQPFFALGAVVTQAFRGMVDAIAISSGLSYRLLRHRARPISVSERCQWQHVWAELTGA